MILTPKQHVSALFDAPGYMNSNTEIAHLPSRNEGNNSHGHPWTKVESEQLEKLVLKHNGKNWKEIARHFVNRDAAQCHRHWTLVLHPSVGRGCWTTEEDNKLLELVKKYGPKWTLLAEHIPNRTRKRCRERYINYLDPNLIHGEWTAKEDKILLTKQEELGNQWTKISESLPGRSVNSIKNRYHTKVASRPSSRENFDGSKCFNS